MFDIISMGEYTLLADAFNGLAMIFNSGPIANMMKLAFLVGILWFGFRAAFFTKWDATPLLAGLIGYMCMFGPKVTVTITDGYSGAVRVVANVPVGIAAPMGITSHAGRYFASTFEQAFAVITPTNSYFTEGYLNSIEVLLKMRAPSQGWASVSVNSRIEATLLNYIKDCVYLDLAMNDPTNPSEVDAYKLTTHKDTWPQLKTTFINVYTTDYIEMVDGRPQELPCRAVYNRLDAQIGTPGTWISTYYDNYLQTQMAASRQAFATSAEARISNALAAINLGAGDARTWMMNTMLGTALRNADSAYQVGQNNIAGTVMVTQAAQQRNAKWAAEKTMFEQVSRPITAFIEMFMVGASPIMAFAIAAFGQAGFSILGKFLMMHVWVTLWVPTSALVNAYLTHTMAKYVEWVQFDRGIELLSQSGLDQLNNQLQTQLATGGMLAAAVPMLTLMLIYGSSQVATQLAGQMRGSEYIDPKIAAPDIVQPGPIVTQSSSHTQNPGLKTQQRTGASVPEFDLGSSFADGASFATANANTNAANATKGINQRYGFTEGGNDKVSFNTDGSFTGTGTFGKGMAAVLSKSLAAGKAAGLTGQALTNFTFGAADQYASTTQGGGSVDLSFGMRTPGAGGGSNGAGGGGKKAGAQAGVGFGLEAGHTWRSSWSEEEAQKMGVSHAQLTDANRRLGASLSDDESVRAGLEWAKRKSTSVGRGKDSTTGFSREQAAGIGDSISQTEQQTKTATALRSFSRKYGMGAKYHPTQLAADFRQTFGNDWTNVVGNNFRSSFGHLPEDQAAAKRNEALSNVANSGTLNNSGMSDKREQAALEQLTAMMLNPTSSPQFLASLGRVSGMDTNGLEANAPGSWAGEVKTGALSAQTMLRPAADVMSDVIGTRDKVNKGVDAKKAEAGAWDRMRSGDFSMDAIQKWTQSKYADVSAFADQGRSVTEGLYKAFQGQTIQERAAYMDWLEKATPDQVKSDIQARKEGRKPPSEDVPWQNPMP